MESIKAIKSAVSDVSAIAVTETYFQLSKAAEVSNNASSTLASKAASLKARYLENLSDRKAGIVKPTVVPESEVPKAIVPVN
ncbi:MAG: hypothetical protein IPQ16_12090 [Geobacteraceae bacterium]|nr:hypothetical protein [Geobacteraceae bacterium]